MSVELRNRPIALITGACGGIGRACSRHLGSTHRLALTDVNANVLGAFERELTEEGFDVVLALAGDLSESAFVRPLVQSSRAAGSLGVLIHTAGLSPSQAKWEKIVQVNVQATHIVLDAFEQELEPGACAILIASIAGHITPTSEVIDALVDGADPDQLLAELGNQLENMGVELDAERAGLAYGWSKRGVMRLVESRSLAWAEQGARIISISPGFIYTPMGRTEFENSPEMTDMIHSIPVGRWGSPNDIARAAEFLISDQASYITGTDLRVDGGFSVSQSSG